MSLLAADPAERLKRKLRRITRNSAWSASLGAGLLLVHLFFSEQSHKTNAVFTGLGIAFLSCGLLQLACLMFARMHAVKVNFLLTYAVMPAVLIKLAADYMSHGG